MGGGHDHGTLAAVLDAEHVEAEDLASAGGLPYFDGLEGGQAELLSAGGVHLLADDLLDLAQGAPCEGQVAVDSRGDLGDEACPDHEAVAGYLRLGGVVPKGLAE